MKLLRTVSILVLCLAVLAIAALVIPYETIPLGNTKQEKFDTIIVLGFPANADGTVSAVQRERVSSAVHEYKAGIAPMIIMSGGKAHNLFAEAHVMAQFAEKLGVPEPAIVEEGRAMDTIQNAYYSTAIMRERGWKSAEVVSSNTHLPRASLIFARFPVRYRMHGATPQSARMRVFGWAAYADEVYKTDRILMFGFRQNRYLP